MRGLLSKILCLIAAITLMDGHIVVLQSYAWVSMLNDRIPEQGVGEALISTFDGEHPCEHCLSVQKLSTAVSQSDRRQDPTSQLQLSGLKALDLTHRKISLPTPPSSALQPLFTFTPHHASDYAATVPTPPPQQG